jgi:hypothetical protein
MNYQLTALGQSLRPVLKAMIVWGLKHIPETKVPEADQHFEHDEAYRKEGWNSLPTRVRGKVALFAILNHTQ